MGENLQAVDKPEEVRLIVSKDNMSAFISFSEPINSDVRIKSDVIKKLLAEKGIVTGIFNKVIETLTTGEKEYEKEYLIAKGVEAVDGKNGSLKYLFDTGAGSHKPKVKDGGRVDYRDLDLFKLVNEGDVLVRVIPPSQGEDGVDIKNNIVKA
ncbi:MAG: FapA family protein, partial [Clostridiales bacterium]|nr:FapA family protein [Clostridiales bacterium]